MNAVTLTLEIASRGDFRLRESGTVPAGYLAADDGWMIRKEFLLTRRLETGAAGALRFTHADRKHIAVEAEHLATLWREAMTRAFPDPMPEAPRLTAGLVPGGLLTAVDDEKARAAQLDDYLNARVRAGGPGPDPDLPLEDRLLRHLATLHVASTTTLHLQRDRGGLGLHLHEAGAVERLLDRIRIETSRANQTVCELHLDRAALCTTPDRAAVLVAKARAVQLASLAVAFGLARNEPLVVSITHAGLGGAMVRLRLERENRASALARLGRALSRVVAPSPLRPITDADLSAEGAELLVLDAPAPIAPAPDATSLRRFHPVAWQPENRSGLPAWVYAGDDPSVHPRLGQLPFALISGGAVITRGGERRPTMQALAPDEAHAFRKWLNGPRGSGGFRPVFGHLYLQGLEYRLLADDAIPDEAAALRNEIAAIAALPEAPEDLAASARALLDWLGATGKRPLRQPPDEDRLAALVGLGRLVSAGQPLDALHVWAFARHLDRGLAERGREEFVLRITAICPQGLLLRPTGITLRASYASMSGLCDRHDVPLGHPDASLPDLRADRRLLAALRRAQVVA